MRSCLSRCWKFYRNSNVTVFKDATPAAAPRPENLLLERLILCKILKFKCIMNLGRIIRICSKIA